MASQIKNHEVLLNKTGAANIANIPFDTSGLAGSGTATETITIDTNITASDIYSVGFNSDVGLSSSSSTKVKLGLSNTGTATVTPAVPNTSVNSSNSVYLKSAAISYRVSATDYLQVVLTVSAGFLVGTKKGVIQVAYNYYQ